MGVLVVQRVRLAQTLWKILVAAATQIVMATLAAEASKVEPVIDSFVCLVPLREQIVLEIWYCKTHLLPPIHLGS